MDEKMYVYQDGRRIGEIDDDGQVLMYDPPITPAAPEGSALEHLDPCVTIRMCFPLTQAQLNKTGEDVDLHLDCLVVGGHLEFNPLTVTWDVVPGHEIYVLEHFVLASRGEIEWAQPDSHPTSSQPAATMIPGSNNHNLLRYLADGGKRLTAICTHLDGAIGSKNHVSVRLAHLRKRGYLVRIDHEWSVTDLGREALKMTEARAEAWASTKAEARAALEAEAVA